METYGNRQNFGNPFSFSWLSYVSVQYGYRLNEQGEKELHRGIDLDIPQNTSILAIHDGVISEISSDSILGNYIVMEDNKAYQSKYAGWQRCNVSIGQEVKKGEEIAFTSDNSFHLEVTHQGQYLNPMYFVENGETPGIVLVKEVLGADDLPARSTVAQGYEMVITDLEEALKYIGTEVKNGRFNSWAVKGLLARINLYKRDWEKAFSYAEDVINNSPYSLLKTEDYVASWSARYSSESVFDLEISDLDAGNREMFGYVVDPKGYAAISITKEFEDLINENQDDIRRNLLSATAIEGRTYMNKYPGIGGKAAVNNIRVIRLSDIYLIAAEAALKKSSVDQASANKYLNAIIKRAIPGAADVTATEALVLKERRKELVMEGHRFYDIMRLGITVTRQGGYHFLNNTDLISPSYQDYRTILAIPQAEIDVNPNIKQNEGYF